MSLHARREGGHPFCGRLVVGIDTTFGVGKFKFRFPVSTVANEASGCSWRGDLPHQVLGGLHAHSLSTPAEGAASVAASAYAAAAVARRWMASFWYMPLVPMACFCFMLIGIGLWWVKMVLMWVLWTSCESTAVVLQF